MTDKTLLLKPGNKAPNFRAVDDTQSPMQLSQHVGQKVVLYFYPRDNTPGCTQQACELRDAYASLQPWCILYGISADDAASHRQFRNQYQLPFKLLIDTDHRIAKAYGVWQEKTVFGKKTWKVVRSTFVIDEAGKLLAAWYQVKVENHHRRLLQFLQAL